VVDAQAKTKFWRDHIAEMSGQGKSVRGYAAEQGLKLSTLQWWRRKLREADRGEAQAAGGVGLKLVPLRVTAPAVVDRAAGASGGVPATIRIGQAMRIDLRELPPVPWLAALQRAVEERR
jgi:transposase-like protein